MLIQADHTEKAVTLIQSVIELNCFCPKVLAAASFDEKLEFLNAFWDSSVARVGQLGAEGWGRWVANKGEGQGLATGNSRGKCQQ